MPSGRPTPDEVLTRLGGVADAATLLRFVTRSQLRRVLRSGLVVRDARGRYSLPGAAQGLRAAHRLTAVASHVTAAMLHGWEVKAPPPLPVVTVPRNRRVAPERREDVDVRWAHLRPDEVVGGRITSPGRTVMDCAKDSPFDEALAVADSAIRHGAVTQGELVLLAGAMPNLHRAACLRVAFAANGQAANPFESVLRAISLEVRVLRFVPQVVVRGPGFTVRPDLVDERLRVVAEADSFEWHGSRSALRADCRRYNNLALEGWLVLRFAWEDVMFRPDYVRACLEAAAANRPPVGHATVVLPRDLPA
jgi:very-short-patch-repair endonuclease